jgi:hypothetical protein
MAITNAQQFKQLVNPPMEGKKRPGYRGEAAAASDRAGGRNAGRDTSPAGTGNVGDDFDRGSFQDAVRRGELKKLVEKQEAEKKEELVERFRNKQFKGVNFPGFIGAGLNLLSPVVQKGMTVNRNFFLDKVLPSKNFKNIDFTSLSPLQQNALYSDYMSSRLSGEIDAYGNPLNQDDDNDSLSPLVPLTGIMAQTPSDMDQEPSEDEKQLEGLRLAFRADGGRIGAQEGGIINSDIVGGEFDFESARQMYGLGKLVKKVTRTVKKIAKSPIGKAAIIGAGIYGLGGGFGAGGFKFGNLPGASFFGKGSFNPLLRKVGGDFAQSAFGSMISGIPGGGVTAAILGTSALAGLLTAKQEEEAQELSRGEGIDIEAARRSILARAQGNVAGDLRATAFLAEGGKPEPVAKKTMPLLDMDGKEMDLRDNGGFVPIGRMEKADDVPARLSKNEFVFTADAVRNAGDGNVDKGAEVMYNMMKNLEAGGEVSEESQGLEGARKMFQTSQRLEEVL